MTESTPSVPPAEAEEPMSLAGRLFNIFPTPGEVFDSLRAGGWSVGNWLVPMLLACVVAAGSALVIFSRPEILRQLREAQDQQFDKMVSSGKMKKEQADQAKKQMESLGPVITKIAGAVGGAVGAAVNLFGFGLVLWLSGRFAFRKECEFLQALEVAGLASMILILGTVVKTLLIVAMGKVMVAPGPILFVSNAEATNKLHQVLGVINVFDFWFIAVAAMGWKRICGAPALPMGLILYGIWLALCIGMMSVGWAMSG